MWRNKRKGKKKEEGTVAATPLAEQHKPPPPPQQGQEEEQACVPSTPHQEVVHPTAAEEAPKLQGRELDHDSEAEEEEEDEEEEEEEKRLHSFQRRLSRLQNRFGGALKRLTPSAPACADSEEEEEAEERNESLPCPDGGEAQPSSLPPAASNRRPPVQQQQQQQQQQSLVPLSPRPPSRLLASPARSATGGGPRLLSREAMLQAELYRARRQLEEERTKAQEAARREAVLQKEADGVGASLGQVQALQRVLARLSAATAGVHGTQAAHAALVRAVGTEVPDLLEVDQARLFFVVNAPGGDGPVLWTLCSNGEPMEAPLRTGLVGEAALTRRVVRAGGRRMVCVPILRHTSEEEEEEEEVMAVLQLACEEEGQDDGAQSEAVLGVLAQHLALLVGASQRAQVLASAQRRALTRLHDLAVRTQQAQALRRWAAASQITTLSSSRRSRRGGRASSSSMPLLSQALRELEMAFQAGDREGFLAVVESSIKRLVAVAMAQDEEEEEKEGGVADPSVWVALSKDSLLPTSSTVCVEEFSFHHYHDGSSSSGRVRAQEGVVRVALPSSDGRGALTDEARRLVQAVVGAAAAWLSGLQAVEMGCQEAEHARQLLESTQAAEAEAGRLKREIMALHEQVFRLQTELNEVGARLEGQTETAQGTQGALEATERLLTSAWNWESLREQLPAALSLLVGFDHLEYRLQIGASDLGLANEVVGGGEEVDVASSLEARRSPVLAQVLATGAPTVEASSSDVMTGPPSSSSASSLTSRAVLSLGVPLLAGSKVVGAFLVERTGHSATPFAEQDVEAVSRLARVLSGVMSRLAREQLVVRQSRRAPTSQQAMRLLMAAERLWTSSGGSLAKLQETFEDGVVDVLTAEEEDGEAGQKQVHCTLFMVDAQQQAVCGSNGEVVPLGVGALGTVALTAQPARDGPHALYVPVVQEVGDEEEEEHGQERRVLGVVRVHRAVGVEDDGGEDLQVVQALAHVLVPVLHHAQTLQTAFGGMKDASAAIQSLQARLRAVQEEASQEAAARTHAEGILTALQRLHVDCAARGPDSLQSLFRGVETAVCMATGAQAAALLLVLDPEAEQGEGRSGAGAGTTSPFHLQPELWTLWPVDARRQERARLCIGEDLGPAEVHALSQGTTLVLSSSALASSGVNPYASSSSSGAFSPYQSWLFGRVEAEGGLDTGGDDEDVSVLMVPVARLGGGDKGVAGVLEIVKRGPLEGPEEGVLALLAQEVAPMWAWFQTAVEVGRLQQEEVSLRTTLNEQAKALKGFDVGARQAGVLANLAFDLMGVVDQRLAVAVTEAHIQEALDAQGVRLEVQSSLPFDAAESAEGLGVSLGVRKGRLECEVTYNAGEMALGTVSIEGLKLEADADMDEEIQLLVARSWVMLERALGSLEKRRALTASASGWECVSKRLLGLVDLVGDEVRAGRGQSAPPSVALDLHGKDMVGQAHALAAYVRLLEKSTADLLGLHAGQGRVQLYFTGTESALTLLCKATGDRVIGGTPLELWQLVGEGNPEEDKQGCCWRLETSSLPRRDVEGVVTRYFKQWLPLLQHEEEEEAPVSSSTLAALQPEDFVMDVRWPQAAGDATTRRGHSVLSVPILLPPSARGASASSSTVLSESLVAVLVVERPRPTNYDGNGSSPSFTMDDVALTAQWSGRVSRVFGSLLTQLCIQRMGVDQEREAKLAVLCRKWERARARQAFAQWRLAAARDAQTQAALTVEVSESLRARYARQAQMLAFCLECAEGLAPALEEDDADALLTELESVVKAKLPTALQAEACALSLLRPSSPQPPAEKQSKKQGSKKAAPPRKQQLQPSGLRVSEGGKLLSKPIFSLGATNELTGLLEVAVTDTRVEDVDQALTQLAGFLGGMATLLAELGTAKERHGEGAHLLKGFQDQLKVYKDVAEAAMQCEALATDAGGYLLFKCDLAAALLAAAQDLPGLGRVVAEQLPRMVGAVRATLYLPSRVCPGEGGSNAESIRFSAASPSSPAAHPLVERTCATELLERCRITRRRTTRAFVASSSSQRKSKKAAHPQQQLDTTGTIHVEEATFQAHDEVTVLCEPVVDPKDGMLWAVLRVDVVGGSAEGHEAAGAARDKVLEWVASVLATAVESAKRVGTLKDRLALEHWTTTRYRKLAELSRGLGAGKGGDVAWVVDQAAAILGAEKVALFLPPAQDEEEEDSRWTVWKAGRGEQYYLDLGGADTTGKVSAVEHVWTLASQGLSSSKVWGLPRVALVHYHPDVDLGLERPEQVLGLREVRGRGEGGKKGGPVAGVFEAVWSPEALPLGALDVARAVAKELGRQVTAALQHPPQQGGLLLPAPHSQDTSLSTWNSAPSPVLPVAAGQQPVALSLGLVKDLLPLLLEVPMRYTRIQELMRTVSSQVEHFLSFYAGHNSQRQLKIDLFARDQEGLWTVARKDDQEDDVILTVGGEGRSVLGQVASDGRARVLLDVGTQPASHVRDDLMGVEAADVARSRVALAVFPIATLSSDSGAGATKLRGLLRCVAMAPREENGLPLLSPLEESVLEAVAHVLSGSITVLDSAVASKALQQLFERADAALVQAQSSAEASRDRMEKVHALCTRAVGAARPLWWEPTPSLPSPAQLLAGQAFYGQVGRVAQAAVQHCQRLFPGGVCWKASLVLTKEGGARAGASDRLDVYEWVEGQQPSVRRHEMVRPTGHGAQGGLLGRGLRKGLLMNVAAPGQEERFNVEVDEEEGSPLLLVPLRWPGKGDAVVLGVLRAWHRGTGGGKGSSSRGRGGGKKQRKQVASAPPAADAFGPPDEILAEVYASHVSMALTYARALDGGEDGRGGASKAPPVVAPPPSSSRGPRPRTTPAAAPKSFSVSRAAAAERRESSFFTDDAENANPNNRSQLDEIKKQLQGIHASTRQALSSMDLPTPAAAPAPLLLSSSSLLDRSGLLSLRAAAPSPRDRSMSALDAMNTSLGRIEKTSLLPTPLARVGAEEHKEGAAAAAPPLSSPVDLAQKIVQMKSQNQQLSQSLQAFLNESIVSEASEHAVAATGTTAV